MFHRGRDVSAGAAEVEPGKGGEDGGGDALGDPTDGKLAAGPEPAGCGRHRQGLLQRHGFIHCGGSREKKSA